MKRLTSLFLAALFAFAPIAQADLRATSGAFGPATITSGTISTTVTGVVTLLAQSFVPATAPVDTTEDTLATITVPANTLGANGSLRVTTYWTVTNGASNKVLRVRYSGGAGTTYLQFTVTAIATVVSQLQIANRNATNSQVGTTTTAATAGGFGTSSGAFNTSAVDTTASTTVVVTCQKVTSTDTCTLEGYTAEVIH